MAKLRFSEECTRRPGRARRRLRGAIAAVLVVCGLGAAAALGSESREPEDPRPVVLTTFTVIADMAREVAGDRLVVRSITKPGAEIHGYEPTPRDLVGAAKADLVLENGLGLERWFTQFIELSDAPSVTLTEGIAPIPIGSGSEYSGRANPHAWMSVDSALIYVENIRRAFTRLDPAGADVYAAEAARYAAELRTVGEAVRRELRAVPESRRLLVSCEGAFSYLARDLGLDERYLWPVNAEAEGTPQQIAGLIETVRQRRPAGLFCESTMNPKSMEQVARDTGVPLAGTLYVDSLSQADGPVPSYLELLRHDAATIVRGLTAQGSTR